MICKAYYLVLVITLRFLSQYSASFGLSALLLQHFLLSELTMASADLYSRIHKTAQDFIDSYKEEKCGKDITTLSATRTPNCRQFFLPSSLLAYAPVLAAGRTNSEYEAQILHEITTVFKSWDVTTKSITVDDRVKKAVVYSSHAMHTGARGSGEGKTYVFDFVYILHMTGDGSKVEKIEQFVDTALAGQLMQDHAGIAKAHQKK
jgi:ketosteroid isomerase-like protein